MKKSLIVILLLTLIIIIFLATNPTQEPQPTETYEPVLYTDTSGIPFTGLNYTINKIDKNIFSEITNNCLLHGDLISQEAYDEERLSYIEEKKFCECYRDEFEIWRKNNQEITNITEESLHYCTDKFWPFGFERHDRDSTISQEQWDHTVELLKRDTVFIDRLACFITLKGERWWTEIRISFEDRPEDGWDVETWNRNWMYLYEDAVKDVKPRSCPKHPFLWTASA